MPFICSQIFINCVWLWTHFDAIFTNVLSETELIVKYNIGLKTLLQQGISEPILYGDLVYKFKRIVGKPNFSDQFKKIVKRFKGWT